MRRGRWWTLLTAGLWAPHLLAYLIATVLFLVVAAPVERRIGPLRFVVAAVVTQSSARSESVRLVRSLLDR